MNEKTLEDLPSALLRNCETIKEVSEQFQLAASALAAKAAQMQRERSRRPRRRAVPNPPAPVAGLLHGFARELAAKVNAIDALLTPDQRERLRAVAPGFVHAVLANEADVVKLVQVLLGGSPEAAAFCITFCLPLLEQRFA